MAYDGEQLNYCPPESWFDSRYATRVVVVSGDFPNPCGHMLLQVGPRYFHVARLNDTPLWMDGVGFRRYLRENEKAVKRRFVVNLPNRNAAMLRMEELLSADWLWGVLPHNCASFVEELVEAGGGNGGLYSNCPNLASQSDFD